MDIVTEVNTAYTIGLHMATILDYIFKKEKRRKSANENRTREWTNNNNKTTSAEKGQKLDETFISKFSLLKSQEPTL